MDQFFSFLAPGRLEYSVSTAVNSILPQQLRSMVHRAANYIPVQIDLAGTALFMLYFAAAFLIFSFLGRVVLGKQSSLNNSLSSVMGILFIYAITVVIYTLQPWDLVELLSPLPCISFSGEYLFIFPIGDARFPALCTHILSMVILSFLVNLIDRIVPKGETAIGWFLLRFISILLAMALHLAVHWLVRHFLPELLVTYAPTALLIILLCLLLSGALNLILGMIIAIENPFLGAMYSFFFSNVIGKQLCKAVFTTFILCIIFYLMEYFGYSVICITSAALATYIPLAFVLLALWFLIGNLL